MTQYRHGLEFRDGRWCSRQELDRLRREAVDGGSAAIAAYLRAEQRCSGKPLAADLEMIRRYLYESAQEAFPPPARVFMDVRVIVVRPLGDASRQYSLTATFESKLDHGWISARYTPWSDMRAHIQDKPSRLLLESWDETRGVTMSGDDKLSTARAESIGQLSTWTSKELKRFKRLAEKAERRRHR